MKKLVTVLEKKIANNEPLSKKEVELFNYFLNNIDETDLILLNTLYKVNIYLNSKKNNSKFKKIKDKIILQANKKIKKNIIKTNE